MSRKVLFQLVLPLIGSSILFWLLAFAPGERKDQPALLEMSVILRDGDGAVSTMRRGMEQAAVDLNVELRFLTPSADNSAIEQTQLLERETAGGTQAILLLPADRGVLGEAVSAAAGRTALVTVETDMTEWGAGAAVTMDHQALGEALGEAACNGVPTGGTVLLLDSLPGDNGIRERMLAARETLERAGRQVRIYQWSADTASFTDILRIERPGAVIAFEAAALEEAAELAQRAADAEARAEAEKQAAAEALAGVPQPPVCEPEDEPDDAEAPEEVPAVSAPEKNYTEEELEAYRRAEAMERNALVRAQRLKEKLSQLCQSAHTRYTDSGEELEALSQDLSSVLSRMQDTIADLQVAFDETEEAFEDIQTLSYESVQPC